MFVNKAGLDLIILLPFPPVWMGLQVCVLTSREAHVCPYHLCAPVVLDPCVAVIKSNSEQKQPSFTSEFPGHDLSLKEVQAGAQGRHPEAGAVEECCLLTNSLALFLACSGSCSSQFLIQFRTLVWRWCRPQWPGPSCINNSQSS